MSVELPRDHNRRGVRAWVEVIALIAMIGASGVLVWTALEVRAERTSAPAARPAADLPTEPVSLLGAATKGEGRPKIALMMFTDFQCSYCSQFTNQTLPEIDRAYLTTGKVLLVFRNLPIENVHPQARFAAESSWCAARQGRFWDMHDRLFGNQAALTERSIRKHAEETGLDLSTFNGCLLSNDPQAQITADMALAKRLGVFGTPAFLIGIRLPDDTMKVTSRLNGARPFTEFQSHLERALASVRP